VRRPRPTLRRPRIGNRTHRRGHAGPRVGGDLDRSHEPSAGDRRGDAHGLGGARSPEPRPFPSGRRVRATARAPLRSRPEQPAELLDRGKRGQQLPDGTIARLGGLEPEPIGYDLRGVVVGGEGTLGITTRVAVRITPDPPTVRTLLLSFERVVDAAETVSAVIAAGIVPAAMEVMDRLITNAVEHYVHAGYPTDAAAVLLAEVDGMPAAVEASAAAIASIGRAHGATDVRTARDDAERALLWKGRKTAFGAIAQIAPDYYLHDTVVPRSRLAEVLEQTYRIADAHGVTVMNVFHAGDGNLHPLLLFDARTPGILGRVHAAGAEIVRASLDAGGVLSGEHGIGLEKSEFMQLMFSDDDLDHQNRLRTAFDPDCRCNPGKVLPRGHTCADVQMLSARPDGVWL